MFRAYEAIERLTQTWKRTDWLGRCILGATAAVIVYLLFTTQLLVGIVACIMFMTAEYWLRVRAMTSSELMEEGVRLHREIDALSRKH